MLILAMDSTAVAASVALLTDGAPLAAFHLDNGNTHSETLLPMVESVLRCTGKTVDDIDLFAVSAGPGSFTGVRIGVATVKGLAFGKGKPCVGVSTLEALAENLVPTGGLLCPVMNARRGQVYNALFRAENGALTRLCPDRALSVKELEAELLTCSEPVTLCGDGAELVKNSFTKCSAALPPLTLMEQNAVSVALCAARMAKAGKTCTDEELKPVYLRMPQAERERLQKLQQAKEQS